MAGEVGGRASGKISWLLDIITRQNTRSHEPSHYKQTNIQQRAVSLLSHVNFNNEQGKCSDHKNNCGELPTEMPFLKFPENRNARFEIEKDRSEIEKVA